MFDDFTIKTSTEYTAVGILDNIRVVMTDGKLGSRINVETTILNNTILGYGGLVSTGLADDIVRVFKEEDKDISEETTTKIYDLVKYCTDNFYTLLHRHKKEDK